MDFRASRIDRGCRRTTLPRNWNAVLQVSMTKDELVVQLLKIALGLGFAAYFLWWSLEVLNRLPPH